MLMASFLVLGSAVLLGSVLAVLHLRSNRAGARIGALGGLHGLLALGGLGLLLAALGGPSRGPGMGTSLFGMISAGLIGLAALMGGAILVLRLLKRRLAGALIGVHAILAVSGFVVLAAYVLVR